MCLTFKNAENVGATDWITDETRITLKTAIKAKKFSQKKVWFVGKKQKTNVFQLCCGQRAYVGYIGWKNLESYVEMVAGLPKVTK